MPVKDDCMYLMEGDSRYAPMREILAKRDDLQRETSMHETSWYLRDSDVLVAREVYPWQGTENTLWLHEMRRVSEDGPESWAYDPDQDDLCLECGVYYVGFGNFCRRCESDGCGERHIDRSAEV